MIFSSSQRLKSWVAFSVMVFSIWVQAQTRTNLDVFKTLVDSSVAEALSGISPSQKDIFVVLKLGSVYSIFEDQIYKSIQSRNKNILSGSNLALSYSIENAAVNYGEVFRDGFLGDHFSERKISISGTYRFQDEEMKIKDFYLQSIDTVKFNEIPVLENSTYPITKGEIPSEPLLSNLFEPLVAIATAAVVIALFFSVRSK